MLKVASVFGLGRSSAGSPQKGKKGSVGLWVSLQAILLVTTYFFPKKMVDDGTISQRNWVKIWERVRDHCSSSSLSLDPELELMLGSSQPMV